MKFKNLLKRLPSPLYRRMRKIYYSLGSAQPAPVGGAPGAEPGPLFTDIAPRIVAIPGWFNADDMAHFWLVLGMQAAAGVRGDMLEIGCFHGRSAALLAMKIRAGERLILCDAFDLPITEAYGDQPTPAGVRQNIADAVPEFDSRQLDIVRTVSADLRLALDIKLRFAHVDGGHSRNEALSDLRLCAVRLVPGGVLVADDYRHPRYPGVSSAVEQFLAERADFCVLADLNRSGAQGRKIYLCRKSVDD
jgi:predicted O-methyltransferase YrrM